MATLDLEALARKSQRKVETVAQELVNDLAEAVIIGTINNRPAGYPGTPVKTGNARGSWYSQFGGAGGGPSGIKDKAGSITLAKVSVDVSQLKIGDTISVLNGAKYIRALEEGNSKQAPQGFLRIVLNDISRIADGTAARIRPQ